MKRGFVYLFAVMDWVSRRMLSWRLSNHLSEYSDVLIPADPRSRSAVIEWLFAALNSVEMATLPWSHIYVLW